MVMDKKKKNARQQIWDKQNTIFVGIKLQKSTDSDIIEYLQDKPKQTIFKKAIRLLIKTETENK